METVKDNPNYVTHLQRDITLSPTSSSVQEYLTDKMVVKNSYLLTKENSIVKKVEYNLIDNMKTDYLTEILFCYVIMMSIFFL